MINNKNNLLMIIGLSLVVAVVASIATINITGEVIRQHQDRYGKYKVYTSEEIDAKINDLVTKQGVLDMLNQCQAYSMDSVCGYSLNGTSCTSDSIFGVIPLNVNGQISGNTLCNKIGKTCNMVLSATGDFTSLVGCDMNADPVTLEFSCCSP